jgi:hypothetical protein
MNPDAPDSDAVESDPVLTSTELREHLDKLLREMHRLREEAERLRLEAEERARVLKIPHKSGDN